MLKKLFTFFKKIIFSTFVLYSYNLIMAPFSLMIPINFVTVLVVTLLGLPSILGFIVILLVLF